MNARQTVPPRRRADWTIVDEITVHGRKVTPGTQLTIAGVRGRVTFEQYVLADSGSEWLDVRDGAGQLRAFHVDRVRTVHLRRVT